ncbi:uncharacterized protein RSE6_05171 [Rhynchosporium secalis]|uniref:Uncharacterized protein n=1 Tax=Rhynchosporium secalis TaxID=38038 RepID=A0A1E1M740_RHYSE|nr:uncharacterized protein RSE6_05171 [Rhynchosporium secalis]
MCDSAGWRYARTCKLDIRGFGHPAAIVQTGRRSDEKIKVSFIQFTHTKRIGSVSLNWSDIFLNRGLSYFQKNDGKFRFITYPREEVKKRQQDRVTGRHLQMNRISLQQLIKLVNSLAGRQNCGQDMNQEPALREAVPQITLASPEKEVEVELRGPETRYEESINYVTTCNSTSYSAPNPKITLNIQEAEGYRDQLKPDANTSNQPTRNTDAFEGDLEAQKVPDSQLEPSYLNFNLGMLLRRYIYGS